MNLKEKTAIVIFIEDKSIIKLRKKYDKRPIKPHLTLVYPFQASKDKLSNLKKLIKNLKPFEISLNGFSKSKKEFYLYFNVDQGNKKIMNLHKQMYKILEMKFNNPDMPEYVPHITMGVFSSKKEINQAKKELESQKPPINCLVSKMSIITLGKGWKPKSIEDIFLKNLK